MDESPDESSLTLPLILDEEQHEPASNKVEEVESNFHHESTATTSFLKTFFNGLNALSGVGILSVPYALSSGGWLSLILLFAIAASCFYTGLLIKRCMDMDSDIRTYPDIGERAFGNKGRIWLSVVMNIELYLVATGFLILEGDNLHNIFPASAIILGSILWIGSFDGIGFHQAGSPVNWNGIPTAVSLYAFCYCAHPVFPTLYTSMKNKHQFSNVLLLCFILCTVSYASMAVFGYLMFGSTVQSQITLNLPTRNISSKVAIFTTLVNPISKYALMVTPIVNAAKKKFPSHYSKRFIGLLASTTLVISTVIVALAIPFFAYLMSLVGAFLSVTGSIVFPCFCYLKLSGNYRRFGCEVLIIGCILLLSAAIIVFGTYTALVEIIGSL
ncbi:hypothetical protein PRUPE_3G267100 [Prunus persica]|uniref:Amino acid transporter transmembrane domain-containing protein n=2 Tax=Prunus persica TaxID=3760 RepID=A0A251Q9A8_PRUPE|nr:hypothetical protein PRUPE_3G267100 [Prunus persica]